MNISSNASFRLGDAVLGAKQFFNTSPKKGVIVLVAVAVIIALGLYLFRAGDCLRRFRAMTPRVPPFLTPSLTPASTSTSTPTSAPARMPEVPLSVLDVGYDWGATHYKRSESRQGWLLIQANEQGPTKVGFMPYDSRLEIQEQVGLAADEIIDLSECIQPEDADYYAEQLQDRQFLMPDNRASKVPEGVYQEGLRLGATHYLQLNVRETITDENGNTFRRGWFLINDQSQTTFFISDGEDNAEPCHYPFDTTGSLIAAEVTACRPAGLLTDPYNQTNIPPEFALVFGEEHGATSYMHQVSFDCWYIFCGEKTYSFKRNGVYALIPNLQIVPEVAYASYPNRFFTSEQVRTYYDERRPKQPQNLSLMPTKLSNRGSGMLTPVPTVEVPEVVALFGERCGATHYEYSEQDRNWVIYFGESQSYLYAQGTFRLQPGLSQEVLHERIENHPLTVYTAEQVKNSLRVMNGIVPDYQ
jgi:hypothetical protein